MLKFGASSALAVAVVLVQHFLLAFGADDKVPREVYLTLITSEVAAAFDEVLHTNIDQFSKKMVQVRNQTERPSTTLDPRAPDPWADMTWEEYLSHIVKGAVKIVFQYIP